MEENNKYLMKKGRHFNDFVVLKKQTLFSSIKKELHVFPSAALTSAYPIPPLPPSCTNIKV